MILDAIIPAFNEEDTVSLVVHALLESWVFRSVTVIDDGSTDRTGAAAALAGAQVLCLPQNYGKGQAMLYGHDVTPPDAEGIAFFDADAEAFEPRHARELAELFAQGFDQVAGIQDHGILLNPIARRVSLLTGQRIVRRWVLDQVPRSCQRYTIEAAINHVIETHGGSSCVVTLDGAVFRSKASKVGARGLLDQWRMLREVRQAQADLVTTGECRT